MPFALLGWAATSPSPSACLLCRAFSAERPEQDAMGRKYAAQAAKAITPVDLLFIPF